MATAAQMVSPKTQALFLSYVFPCEAEQLFEYLHNPQLLRLWLCKTLDYNAQTETLTFHWEKGTERATIVEADFKYLILTLEWNNTLQRGEYSRFQVAPTEDDGLCELVIEDFCPAHQEADYRKGWDRLMSRLRKCL